MGKPTRRPGRGSGGVAARPRGTGRGNRAGDAGKAAEEEEPVSGSDSEPELGELMTLNRDGPEDEPEFCGDESSTVSPVLKTSILGLVCLMSFCIRLFAVVRWESVIHEFDPYFNYRTTKFLSNEGFYSFLNWFDDRGWYPLGRIIGGTIYPGLMVTAAMVHGALNAVNISINVRNMCVFLAPLFAANTALATYLLTKEVTRRSSTALLAAAFVGVVPSYISRSVAGSYDNEGVAIFALIFTFYLWVKAVNTGRLTWGAASALGYFYMVAAWGGYVFIINIIPIYVVVMIVAGRYSRRLYVAYSTFYVLGSLLAMQVPFVGFNVIKQAECAASHGVFVLLQAYAFGTWLRSHLSSGAWRRLAYVLLFGVVGGAAALLLCLQLFGLTQWTGRSLSLLDPTYAKKYIPIISSVSEHQPTSWTSFFFDLHICVPFAPVGLFFLFRRITDAKIFLILYGTISWYFAGVMVRLMLTLAPVACMLAAVGLSGVFNRFMGHLRIAIADEEAADAAQKEGKRPPQQTRLRTGAATFPAVLSLVIIGGTTLLLCFYAMHATYVASEAYSSPSIVLATTRGDGSKVILDDFREAYYWLRQNTDPNAKIMSWWDYGYQMSAMANRTVLVDNNTWNNTHIATVGRAMASSEDKAYPILQSLDVDYVLAIFGGVTGYQSDDINKFLWMVRIGGGVYPDEIQEPNYFSADGQYTMGSTGSSTMHNCLMYKMCYYRFDELATDLSRPKGFDRARNLEIGHKGFELETLSEAFTSEHWIVRIYKVKKPSNTLATESAVARRAERRRKSKRGRRYRKAKKEPAEPEPAPRFVGCYTAEVSFGADRVYGGGATGANLGLAKHFAKQRGKRYFAVARSGDGNYGHAFAFDRPLAKPDVKKTSIGCSRPCMDDAKAKCGCSDDYCAEPLPRGQEFNRRWAVYELHDKSMQAAAKERAAKAAKKQAKKGKTSKGKRGKKKQ